MRQQGSSRGIPSPACRVGVCAASWIPAGCFPTLLIIDQSGVVRDIQVGYSPTLAKNVIASVEKLLASPPVAAP